MERSKWLSKGKICNSGDKLFEEEEEELVLLSKEGLEARTKLPSYNVF